MECGADGADDKERAANDRECRRMTRNAGRMWQTTRIARADSRECKGHGCLFCCDDGHSCKNVMTSR